MVTAGQFTGRVSPERRAVIIKMYAQGISQQQIADRMRTSRTTVSSIIKRSKE